MYFLFIVNIFFSQEKEKQLKEITIEKKISHNLKPKSFYVLTKREIQSKQAEDLGDLLKSIPGITLKNYGGLGGLKTISARGINGTHTGIYVDGVLLQNQITGQMDLSSIQLENVEDVKFTYQNQDDKIHAISSYFFANNLFINTFENQFTKDTVEIRSSVKIGSFGRKEIYLGSKFNFKNSFASISLNYRNANGEFPYTIQNYSQEIKDKRKNNDLKELNGNFSLGHLFKNKSSLKFQNHFNKSDKGLPGAVILYNPISSQRLYNQSINSGLNYFFILKNKFAGRIYANNRYEELIYIDSNYNNINGYLKTNYFSNYTTLGLIFKNRIGPNFVYYGLENENSNLIFSENHYKRNQLRYILDLALSIRKFKLDFLVAFQQVFTKDSTYNALNPSLTFKTKDALPYLGSFNFVLKRTLRMPTFSELYFNQFYNSNLMPEISNQISLGSFYEFKIFKQDFDFSYTLFCNMVENKIVATPTKNLFVWSIQNAGNVLMYGSELYLNYNHQFSAQYSAQINSNYTFQKVLNYNNDSPTFLHQLAYMPLHTFNLSLGNKFKNLGYLFSIYYISERYALNENINSNLISSFCIFDFNLFYTLKIKNNEFRLTASLKNFTNKSYEYIRNYVMPGRNILISLAYGFH